VLVVAVVARIVLGLIRVTEAVAVEAMEGYALQLRRLLEL
jgi:hypothetical protein